MQMKRFASKTAVSLLLALGACGAPEGEKSQEPLGSTAQALTARGWDPFLNIPNAWTKSPEQHRFCQGGGCSSTLGYAVASSSESSCAVRGVGYDTYGTGGLCPNWFNWEWDASVGRWKAHIISVPGAGQNGYQYVGLEQYINNTRSFPAWDFSNTNHWPYVSWVHSVHLQVRARYCNQNSNARMPYYFAWVVPSNPSLDGQVSIDLLTYVGAPPALGMPDPGPSQTEEYLATRAGVTVIKEEMKRTFEVNGASWGVKPNNYGSSQLWCYNSINDAPWLDFSINIPAVLSRLQQEGRLPTPLPADMRYSGGIIGGIEFWGPVGGWAEVELRDHEIWTY